MVKAPPLLLYPRGREPVPILQEAGWAPGTIWMGVENFTPTGIRSQNLPARSEPLYRLRYAGPLVHLERSECDT
jgi:hypothetical protein